MKKDKASMIQQLETFKKTFNELFFDEEGNPKAGQLTIAIYAKEQNTSLGYFDINMKSSDKIKDIPVGDILYNMKDALENEISKTPATVKEMNENIIDKNVVSDAIIEDTAKEVIYRNKKYQYLLKDGNYDIKNESGDTIKEGAYKNAIIKIIKNEQK